jgi:hypothetical protein
MIWTGSIWLWIGTGGGSRECGNKQMHNNKIKYRVKGTKNVYVFWKQYIIFRELQMQNDTSTNA